MVVGALIIEGASRTSWTALAHCWSETCGRETPGQDSGASRRAGDYSVRIVAACRVAVVFVVLVKAEQFASRLSTRLIVGCA